MILYLIYFFLILYLIVLQKDIIQFTKKFISYMITKKLTAEIMNSKIRLRFKYVIRLPTILIKYFIKFNDNDIEDLKFKINYFNPLVKTSNINNIEDCKFIINNNYLKDETFTVDYLVDYPLKINNDVKKEPWNEMKKKYNKSINIILQSYPEKNENRLNELLCCLRTNLNNKYIFSIHDLCEKGTKIPEDILNHPKYFKIEFENRLKFIDAFDYAQKNFGDEFIFCIINNDIFLDYYDFKNINDIFLTNHHTMISPCRFNVDNKYKIYIDKSFNVNSNDLFCFKLPFRKNINLKLFDFYLGIAGCDNAIISIFYNLGYRVLIWPFKFRIYHYDFFRKSDYKCVIIPNSNEKISISNIDSSIFKKLTIYNQISE